MQELQPARRTMLRDAVASGLAALTGTAAALAFGVPAGEVLAATLVPAALTAVGWLWFGIRDAVPVGRALPRPAAAEVVAVPPLDRRFVGGQAAVSLAGVLIAVWWDDGAAAALPGTVLGLGVANAIGAALIARHERRHGYQLLLGENHGDLTPYAA